MKPVPVIRKRNATSREEINENRRRMIFDDRYIFI